MQKQLVGRRLALDTAAVLELLELLEKDGAVACKHFVESGNSTELEAASIASVVHRTSMLPSIYLFPVANHIAFCAPPVMLA